MNQSEKLPDFDEPQLAKAVEALSSDDLDKLPFGAIRLDHAGVVRIYNQTERTLSGYGKRPTIGLDFFTRIAPCMDNAQFRGRIQRALQAGTLDIEFSHIGDFDNELTEMTIRIQSAADAGYWIFIRRED